MVDLAIGVVTEAILKMVISLAGEEICLARGMKEELKKLAGKLKMIQALLSDAQRNQVNSEAVGVWLKSLGSIALDAQIVLDEIGYQVLRQEVKSRKRDKVRNWFSSNNPVLFHIEMAHKIKDVLHSFEELYMQSKELNLVPILLENSLPDLKDMRLTGPCVEESKILGRKDDTLKVINMLIGSKDVDLPVITILGMGGQGKTTLAQLIYNHDKVTTHFEKRVWVCISEDFSVERLLGEMLQSFPGANHQLTTIEALVNELKGKLLGKRYLLVLDDVWNDNRELWDRMRSCLLGIGGSKDSKVLATTRREDVASAMNTSKCYQLQKLSEKQSWLLFEKYAFANGGATKTPQLIEVGKQILKRCGGLPLAIKTIGSLLNSKKSEAEWLMIERSNWWSANTGGNIALSAIKLSYDHLPLLPIKQCFAYCSIFEKDSVLRKDKLIELWMAHGLLNPPEGSNLQMEEMGEIYFDILLRNSLFQDVCEGSVYETITCKMHDLVHDVSLQVMGNYCRHVKDGEDERNKIEAVHVSINYGERRTWNISKYVLSSKLQTLHMKGRGLLEDFFERFRYLSALIIQNWGVKELPNSIGQMKHLRLVDIYYTSITQLPKSFTKLYYLQTLRVKCLEEVPEGFGNLINLRHIHMDNYGNSKLLFPGISQLRNLQTLPHFKVDRRDGCQIEELEHMHNLRGTLRIWSLQNVVDYESAVKSNLSEKLNIQNLELKWDEREKECDDTEIMEGLKPHSHLKGLDLNGYQGSKFPSWMITENHVLRLRNLVKLTLRELNRCEKLPSLGDLPCLEELRIDGLDRVTSIGEEFYGWSNLEWISSNDSETITLFPALKRFKIKRMESLVEWSNPVGNIRAIHPKLSSVQIKAFPKLTEMTIKKLPKLTLFPNLGSLPSLEMLEVRNCSNLTISFSEWNRRISSSQELDVDILGHSSLDGDSDIQHSFKSLKDLWLDSCEKLTKPICSLINNSSTPLVILSIFCHPDSWPEDLHHLSSLRELYLGVGYEIKELDQVECYPWSFRTSGLVSLTSLCLIGRYLPNLTYLPDQIQHLTRLEDLCIEGFEKLEALPDWMGEIVSIQYLEIINCKSIKQLPSVEAFQRLVNLRTLHIDHCPVLEERCTKGSGSEWPKIAHIPGLLITSG